MAGTHQGEFMCIPASGAPISVEGFDLIRVRDGVCVKHWGVQDNAVLLEQVGAMPTG